MIANMKSIRSYFRTKEMLIVLITAALVFSSGIAVFYYLRKDVTINDGSNRIVVKTMKNTVEEVLEQAGITVRAEDYVSMPMDAKIEKFKDNEITIKRAVPVTIVADGKETKIMTYKDTVQEAILDSSVAMYPKDRLEGASLDSKIVPGMRIKIVRVTEEIQEEQTEIPFKVITRENHHMDKGTEKVAKEGKEGIYQKLFRVVFEDGKEVLRELIKEGVLLAPVDRVVEVGTILNHKTARGDIIRYSKVLNMRATAYTSSFKDTGKTPDHPQFGITYTGIKAKKGVVAVDPKVIPLGSKLYVEVAGSTPDYGYAVAADIGGAVKGNIIDLYFEDQETVDNWGVKRVKVYILLDK